MPRESEGRREADATALGEGQGRAREVGRGRSGVRVRAPSPQPAGATEHAQCDCPGLARTCSEAPASSCTCRGCLCSNARQEERAKSWSMPRNPAGGRVDCWEGGGLKMKAEAGALSGVTDASLGVPVHRCKGPDDCTGHCTRKPRNDPYSEDTPAFAPRFPQHGLQPHFPFTPLSDHNRSQVFDCSSLSEKTHLPSPPSSCPQGVSLSTKNNPLLCLQCVSPHPALSPPHLPLPRQVGSFALKNESSQLSTL